MQLTAALITALIGASLVVQIGLNASMRAHVGSAAGAAFVNFAVGTVALALYAVATRAPIPSGAQLAGVPWWAWMGGLFGACYVAASTVLGPLLGGAAFVALVVAGQMLTSLYIDHYGLLGFAQRPVDFVRLLGAALVVVGVVLLVRR
ncbi:MAG: DMT family transporter [Steroidobacteraceae bacterium]|nr:DMT family transporter [Steroidobacteraceae bacterium]MCC7199845.1 DMT family transporter [Gammaproteobacteria bacterium]